MTGLMPNRKNKAGMSLSSYEFQTQDFLTFSSNADSLPSKNYYVAHDLGQKVYVRL